MVLQKEVVWHVKKTEKYRALDLSYEEILLLQQIYIHRIINTRSIHEFLEFSSGRRNSTAISNRLRIMLEAGVLGRVTEPVPFGNKGFKRYFYKLGTRGIRVLIDIGYCTDMDGMNMLRLTHRITPPKPHANSASLTANRILLGVTEPRRIEFIQHLRGAVHPFFVGENLDLEVKGVIIPDWVFETNEFIVCIEVDTGSSRGNEIKSKVKRYIKRANGLDLGDRKIVVIFSILDDTLETLDYSNRFKRVSSIKEQISLIENIPTNLSFYVVQTKNTPLVTKNVYEGREPASREQREAAIHQWLKRFKAVANVNIYTDDLDSILSSRRDKKDDGEALLQVEVDGHTRRTIVIYGEEGSVDTYQRIRANAYRLRAINQTLPSHEQIGLLVVYPTQANMTEEVLGWHSPIPIWMTSMDIWEIPDTGLEVEGTRFMRLVSPFKLAWEEWEVLAT